MRHQAYDLGRGRRQLGQPVAPHAGVELEVDAKALRDFRLGDRELERRFARLGDLPVGARWSEHQDPLHPVLAPQRQAFRDRRDTQRGRARTERSAGRIHGPVAVAVSLDDHPELRAVEQANQRAHVPAEGAQIDRDLGTVHLPEDVR